MKPVLVVYFSRTGRTETVARAMAELLDADVEGIQETRRREGLAGFRRSSLEAMLHIHPVIGRAQHRPQDHPLVVIGTPVWAWNMSSPVRTYIRRHWSHCAQVALFCTMGSGGGQKVLHDMARLLGKRPVVTLALKESDVDNGRFTAALPDFVQHIQSASTLTEPMPV